MFYIIGRREMWIPDAIQLLLRVLCRNRALCKPPNGLDIYAGLKLWIGRLLDLTLDEGNPMLLS